MINRSNKYLVIGNILLVVWLLNATINIFYSIIDNIYMVVLQVLLFSCSVILGIIHRKKNNLPILAFLHGEDKVKNARNKRAIIFGLTAILVIVLLALLIDLLMFN